MQKIDLNDVTFTIPVKIDHKDRENNLKIIVSYLNKYFDTTILICEQDTDEVTNILKGCSFNHMSYKSSDGLIHRTKILNMLAKKSETPIIANYDADVVFKPSQYVEAVNMIRNNEADGVFPYAGRFEDVERSVHKLFRETLDISVIKENHLHLNHPNSLGGAIFWNKQKFFEGGGENEKFISWGWEDNERYNRFKRLGYRIKRIPGLLYHLSHYRGKDSSPKNPEHLNNQKRFKRTMAMNKEQLLNEIKTWEWCK